MSIRDKILSALTSTLEDLSEERLVDILIDELKSARAEVERRAGENIAEYQRLQQDREHNREEYLKMHREPLYCVKGEFHFATADDRFFCIHVQGTQLGMFERRLNVDYQVPRISHEEWVKRMPKS